MASLATHFCASLFLVPIGLRRLFCSSSLYLENPSSFRSRPWYLSEPKWKNLDLYILTVALPIASFSEIFLFLSFSGHPTYRFSFLLQSLLIFLYWVLTILFLLQNSIVDPVGINDSFLFLITGILFFIEFSLTGKGISGLVPDAVYGLSGKLNFVSGFCCLYLAIRPIAFSAEFCLSCGLVLKGSWFLQSGLSLYSQAFAFKGCQKVVVVPGTENAEMNCDLEEDGLRGVALVNLLFVGHAIGVLLLSLGVFGLLSSDRNLRHGDASGPLLAGLESEGTLMMGPIREFELE